MLLYFIAGVEGFIIFGFTLGLLFKYGHKEAGFGVKASTFIGWFLGFSIIAILPLDIYIVLNNL